MSPRDPNATPGGAPDRRAMRTALDWARDAGASERVIRETERIVKRRQRRRMRRTALGAAALLAAGMVVAWRFAARPAEAGLVARAEATKSAVVATPERQVLPDGSMVELKDGAIIEANFSGPLRRVALKQGEALFHVAKNPARAFVVSARGVEVRAVGTAFSVQLGREAVEVLVAEGRVAVNQIAPRALKTESVDASVAGDLAMLDAGNRVVIDVGTPNAAAAVPPQVIPVSREELAERLGWSVPRLEFSGTPLAEAIAIFNRHAAGDRHVRLELGDASLGSLRLSGILRADNIDALLRLLENEFSIRAERRGDLLVLRR